MVGKSIPRRKSKMAPAKKKIKKVAVPDEQRIKYGSKLGHSEAITMQIRAVNNGWVVEDRISNTYVFSEKEEVIEFMASIIPMKGTEADFINALSDDTNYDDEELPF